MPEERRIKRHTMCPACVGQYPVADLSGGRTYIRQAGIVDSFSVYESLGYQWTLGLFLHGRWDITKVWRFNVILEPAPAENHPGYLCVERIVNPEGMDGFFKTILGATSEFTEHVDRAMVIRDILPQHFLVVGDENGARPRMIGRFPLMHIHASFTSFE